MKQKNRSCKINYNSYPNNTNFTTHVIFYMYITTNQFSDEY